LLPDTDLYCVVMRCYPDSTCYHERSSTLDENNSNNNNNYRYDLDTI